MWRKVSHFVKIRMLRLRASDLGIGVPMNRKFNDDNFVYFIVIMKNVVISFINEYTGPILRPPCDAIDDAIIMSNTFLP